MESRHTCVARGACTCSDLPPGADPPFCVTCENRHTAGRIACEACPPPDGRPMSLPTWASLVGEETP